MNVDGLSAADREPADREPAERELVSAGFVAEAGKLWAGLRERRWAVAQELAAQGNELERRRRAVWNTQAPRGTPREKAREREEY